MTQPIGYNLNDLLAAFNGEAAYPATKRQLTTKIDNSNIFRQCDYALWRNEILNEVESRQKRNEKIDDFHKPTILKVTIGGKWTSKEDAVGSEIMEKSKGDTQSKIIAKIYKALQGRRSEVAIKVRICLFC